MKNKTLNILLYQWKDLFRGKWVAIYGLVFLSITDLLIRFAGGGDKALVSLTNVMLLFIPLISIVYGVLYLYQSREFIELLLSQPLDRKSLFWGLYGGLALPLAAAYVIGAGLPLAYLGVLATDAAGSALMVLGLGAMLTLVFIGLGYVLGLKFFDDRIKGLGFALVIWLFLAVLYDGFILLVVYLFGDYPLERIVLGISLINPVDLARIFVLLKFDISALMGYTGAVFHRFFGNSTGMLLSGAMILFWLGIPLWRGVRRFAKKDF